MLWVSFNRRYDNTIAYSNNHSWSEGETLVVLVTSQDVLETNERKKRYKLIDKKRKKQVWSTNRCVLLPFFSTFNMDTRTDQLAYLPIEMQFYITVMFLGFPDDVHEDKPSFLEFEKNALPTNRRTDRPSYRDTRTHLNSTI